MTTGGSFAVVENTGSSGWGFPCPLPRCLSVVAVVACKSQPSEVLLRFCESLAHSVSPVWFVCFSQFPSFPDFGYAILHHRWLITTNGNTEKGIHGRTIVKRMLMQLIRQLSDVIGSIHWGRCFPSCKTPTFTNLHLSLCEAF